MLESFFDLDLIRILISVSMLGLASAIDLKKREINDKLWIGFSGVAVLLLFASPNFWTVLKTVGLSMIVAPIALVLWRFGIFGGADALCLIVLAGLAPMSTMTQSQISPFTTLANASILTVIPILINLGRNVVSIIRGNDIFQGIDEPYSKKILAMFVGYRTKNPKHSFCIEQTVDGKRHLDFSPKHAENTSYCYGSDVWVTPGLPYILYITGGFMIQAMYGDLILNLIHLL
jgi:preflagellin peptidase FlaK